MSLQFEQDRQWYSKQPVRNSVQQHRISRTEIISLPDIGVKCQECMKDTSKLSKFQNIYVKILFTNRLSKKSLKEEKIFIKKNPTRCKNISIFLYYYYSIFIRSSTCFGRHTAHHQEPKTALAASGFSYVEGCWTCSWWTLSGTVCA